MKNVDFMMQNVKIMKTWDETTRILNRTNQFKKQVGGSS